MKLVMTLIVRDEVDILDEQIAFHLNAGIDFVVATDHRSIDGTTDILESYARENVLQLIREEAEFTREHEWQTRMARLAASEHRADWVINSAADEFWYPRGPSLKDVLASVPSAYGVVRGLVRNFIPPLDDRGWFAERLTLRLAAPAPINDPATPFRPVVKVAHRAHPNVVVAGGHQVFGHPWRLLRGWYPLEVLHFPLRSREQCAGKYRKTWTGWEENLRGDLARAREAAEHGRPHAIWERVALDESLVDRGLAEGSLVSDTRLRDRLRALRADASGFTRPRRSSDDPSLTLPTRLELDAHALEAAVFDEAELVRSRRWLDAIEARLAGLEVRRRSKAPLVYRWRGKSAKVTR